jgi:phage-related baseplate assembly protein
VNLLAYVQKVIDGDPLDRANFPGMVAAGIRALAIAPSAVVPSVEAVLALEAGTNRSSAIASAVLAVQNYINTRGISGDIIRNEIIERLMGVAGVVDVTLILPSSNIVVLDDEIPRITTLNINIT